MKKGKSIKLSVYNSIKTSFGTVDSKNFKSLFVNVQSWVTPKKNYENWNRIVSSLLREVKLVINESLDKDIFHSNYIVDLDLRTSGLQEGKKSFFNLEITVFIKDDVEFKSMKIKESVKKIIKCIFKDTICNNHHFDFSSSKTDFQTKV